MPKIAYEPKNFKAAQLEAIEQANKIIAEYDAAGFKLTLRQLYYQFVSRALIPNNLQSYKRLGSIINDARMAGMIDWDSIEDRTRNVRHIPHWSDPSDVVYSAAYGYRRDSWDDQDERVEIWVEKEALLGVVERVANEWDVPFFACKGYVSQSEAWSAPYYRWANFGRRIGITVLYLGDHDPSGLDMTRDLRVRLNQFAHDRCGRVRVERLALNWDQVEQYQPPPNPAKLTDSRAEGYIAEFGDESWELDALEPRVIHELVADAIAGIVDQDKRDKVLTIQAAEKLALKKVYENWSKVAAYAKGL